MEVSNKLVPNYHRILINFAIIHKLAELLDPGEQTH